MNSSIACRYPRFDSGERRLSRTADLLWSRSGMPSFVFGRFSFEDFRLACLLIPAASTAAGQEPMPARRRVGRFTSKWRCQCGCRMLADFPGVISHKPVNGQCDKRHQLWALRSEDRLRHGLITTTIERARVAGRRVPHPRHWQALAELVGVRIKPTLLYLSDGQRSALRLRIPLSGGSDCALSC